MWHQFPVQSCRSQLKTIFHSTLEIKLQTWINLEFKGKVHQPLNAQATQNGLPPNIPSWVCIPLGGNLRGWKGMCLM